MPPTISKLVWSVLVLATPGSVLGVEDLPPQAQRLAAMLAVSASAVMRLKLVFILVFSFYNGFSL